MSEFQNNLINSQNIPNPINQPITQNSLSKSSENIPVNQPLCSNIKGFNPLTHQPPKYDLYGVMIPQPYLGPNQRYNILADKEKIRIPWESANNRSTPMTRTKLLEMRKAARRPDISYDLDGDGYVGGKDYVLSKIYDVDNDGKLNEQEKKNAYEGIKNGVEKKYMWNLDNHGGKRAFRILQRRGKIIDAEDFLPITDTYPKHPLSKKTPSRGIRTKKELDEFRKKETINEINNNIKKYEEKHPKEYIMEERDYHSDYKPPFSSMNEIRDKFHRECRIKGGLNEYESLIKENNPPSLNYIENPKHKTYKDIEEERRKENLEKGILINSLKHKNDNERLNEREDEIFANLYHKESGLTYEKIKEQRKKETLEYNTKNFSEQPIGVHGHELPKFSDSENTKEFWKLREDYVDNPEFNSQVEFLEQRKYWKKREDMLIDEHKDYDPDKENQYNYKEYVKKPVRDQYDISMKVNEINFYKDQGFDPNIKRELDIERTNKSHIYRWTSLVHQFAAGNFKNGRIFDVIENDEKSKKEALLQERKEREKLRLEKEKNEIKEKTPEEMGIYKQPLFSKFTSKDEIKLNKSTMIKSKGF